MERPIEATTALALPFDDAILLFHPHPLRVLIGAETRSGEPTSALLETAIGADLHHSQRIDVHFGDVVHDHDTATIELRIVPLQQVGGLGTIGPFQGWLELRRDDDVSTLRLHGRYCFTLPQRAHYGDGLLLHRLVRRSFTHLLEQLAVALRVEARVTRRTLVTALAEPER